MEQQKTAESPVVRSEPEALKRDTVNTKSVVSFTIGELISTIAGLVTLITVLVTFFVSYNGTKQTVEILVTKVDSTNAKLERIISRLEKQGTALDAIVERDTSLQSYMSKHNNHF